jgi:flagellar biosynthesis GTPase FlhF
MLRAFNGECDSYIARVNYRNIEAMKKRIESSFDQINKLAEGWGCVINSKYLASRRAELQLVFEYEEQKQKEKEEQAQIREQMREEQKAEREAEKARQQAEKEEAEYQEMLERAKQEAANGSEADKAALNSKVEELQRRISEIEDKKRAISQAMLTRTGHVYILSNVGSFGENVYKIGMTRRLDPMDRVNELGDASVPFPFDVHALISTTDAPALESSLHKHFGEKRVNLENERKEFFRVSIEEIKIELGHLKDSLGIESDLQLTLVAEAKQYRISEAKRRQSEERS